MLRLHTLGGLRVQRDVAPSDRAPLRPRALGLMAFVAAAREPGVSRDKALAYLWPESDEARARHVLAQMLYVIRQRLGGDDPFVDTPLLRLDPSVVTVDAWEFEDAIARGHGERAAALYGGPFLDGFFLSGAAAFEQWVERERDRLGTMARGALEASALAAGARGDHAGAVAWWQRVAAMDPLNARVAAALMRALAATGDRTAALRHARVHEELVRQELGETAEPEVLDALAEVRRRAPATPPPAERPPAGESASRNDHAADGMAVAASVQSRYERYVAAALASRFRVERSLGRRGLATSFAGSDVRSGAGVVLHVLLPTLAAMVDAERLLDALHAAARLVHPGIFPIVAAGREGDVIYIATPPATGELLAARLARERQLQIADVVRLGRDLAAALQHGHAHDILHLDLTPRRVLLAANGAQVLDFGVMRAVLEALPSNASQTGIALGSVAYMSPEQASAEPPDGRSDIYSLGCILHAALVGEPPHTAPSPRATLMRRLTEPPPSARALRDTIPAELDRVLARALARVPADRFASAAALHDALAALVAGPEPV